MSDGILKSNPEEIWNYYMCLNKSLEYIKEAVKDICKALNHLEERLEKKKRIIQEKIDNAEAELSALLGTLGQTEDDEKRAELQAKIAALQNEIGMLQDKEMTLRRVQRQIPQYIKRLTQRQKKCVNSFAGGKRILNAYIKLLEVENVKMELRSYEHSSIPGQYDVMKYRGNTFYCNNIAFDPQAVDSEGRTNLQRMESGIAPIGYDGMSVELHHTIQSEKGGIVEILGSTHRENHKMLHFNTSDIPSGIERTSFDVLRAAYWKKRADLLKAGGVLGK